MVKPIIQRYRDGFNREAVLIALEDEMFPYSVTCSVCGTSVASLAANPFDFCAEQVRAGWVIPGALENKPIWCPKCKLIMSKVAPTP
jgi:hypothetical protein